MKGVGGKNLQQYIQFMGTAMVTVYYIMGNSINEKLRAALRGGAGQCSSMGVF